MHPSKNKNTLLLQKRNVGWSIQYLSRLFLPHQPYTRTRHAFIAIFLPTYWLPAFVFYSQFTYNYNMKSIKSASMGSTKAISTTYTINEDVSATATINATPPSQHSAGCNILQIKRMRTQLFDEPNLESDSIAAFTNARKMVSGPDSSTEILSVSFGKFLPLNSYSEASSLTSPSPPSLGRTF